MNLEHFIKEAVWIGNSYIKEPLTLLTLLIALVLIKVN